MLFSEKLSQLMKLTGISNKMLAAAIHVDASLISRWRTGDRAPNKGSEYFSQLAKYFASSITDYQRAALLALMNLPIDMSANKDMDLAPLLKDWLSRQSNGDVLNSMREIVDRFLLNTDRIHLGDALTGQNYYEETPHGRVQTDEIFPGYQGMQDATFKLLSLLVSFDEPQTMYMFSDQRLSWLNDDAGYDMLWRDLMMRCLQKGHKVCVIHSVVRDNFEMFSIIERWLPLFMTGNVTSYYCPRHLNSVYCHTVNIVPDLAAITSTHFSGDERDAVVHFQTDKQSLHCLLNGFMQHLKICKPLLNTYTTETFTQLQEEHLKILHAPGNTISSVNTFSSINMPEPIFIQALDDLKLDSLTKKNALRLFQLKQKIFHENLKNYTYREMLIVPEPQLLLREGLQLNMTMFFCNQNIPYRSLDDIKEHVRKIIHLLENYKNYQCYLLHETPFYNVQLQSKDSGGVVFTKQSNALYTFILTQQGMSRVFYNYLENIIFELPKRGHDRDYTINRLKEYLAL